MREVRMALLEADVNYGVAKDFCAAVSKKPWAAMFFPASLRGSR